MKMDFIVVGGGCVGLATAYQLLKKYPGKKLLVLEKEKRVASHQTGRNSGVIHSGIYYKPGSFKATNCRIGKILLEEFCKENNIPFDRVGKLIVANGSEEESRLNDIYLKGKDNGINCRFVSGDEMNSIEPFVSGSLAVHVPETGIVNYAQVCRCLVQKIEQMGGIVATFEKLVSVEGKSGEMKNSLTVQSSYGDKALFYQADYLVNCAGLYADHVMKLCGLEPEIKIIPFRGEYYTLKSGVSSLVRGLIYPVPDPRFPFLGVHFTKMIGGEVECGPNAVLAFGRESYNKNQVNVKELWETLTYSGFWTLSFKYWEVGVQEMLRSLFKSRYTASLKKLIPVVKQDDLLNNRPSGIRAQAVRKDGSLVDDFVIESQGNITHVLNAPSPAATACLQIGNQIVSKMEI